MSKLSGVYPALQEQTVLDFCAIKAWLAFARQLLHGAEPLIFLYFDAPHAEQGPPLGPVYPGLHRQSVASVRVSNACELFSGQYVHTSFPMVDLYVDCGHEIQYIVPVRTAAELPQTP